MYLVMKGDWGSLTLLENEDWQFGIRFILNNGSIDDIGVLPTVDISEGNTSRSETDWDINTGWTATSGLATFNPDDWLNDQVLPAIGANWPDLIDSSHCSLRTVTVYPIDHTGHVTDGRSCVATLHAPATGVSGSSLLPIENAVVVSTRTNRLGPRGRGRFYTPGVVVASTDGSGVLDTTHAQNVADAAAAMLVGMAYDGSGLATFSVKPIVTGSPWSAYAVIDNVDVGTVVDTQRRRRRQLVETRFPSAVAYGF